MGHKSFELKYKVGAVHATQHNAIHVDIPNQGHFDILSQGQFEAEDDNHIEFRLELHDESKRESRAGIRRSGSVLRLGAKPSDRFRQVTVADLRRFVDSRAAKDNLALAHDMSVGFAITIIVGHRAIKLAKSHGIRSVTRYLKQIIKSFRNRPQGPVVMEGPVLSVKITADYSPEDFSKMMDVFVRGNLVLGAAFNTTTTHKPFKTGGAITEPDRGSSQGVLKRDRKDDVDDGDQADDEADGDKDDDASDGRDAVNDDSVTIEITD